MRRPLAVIFDLGDTILQLASADWAASPRRLLQLATDPDGLSVEDIHRVWDEMGRELFPAREESLLELQYESFLRILCETLGISLGVSYSEAAREVWNASMRYAPVEGIRETVGDNQTAGLGPVS